MTRQQTPAKILLSPFLNPTNSYIELQKLLFRQLGYEVSPLSVRSLARGGVADLLDRSNLLVFHWLERRAFRRKGERQVLSLRGCAEFLFYLAVIWVARAKTVYFVHDHSVHGTHGSWGKLSSWLIAILARVATARVVHDPTYCAAYGASYLPHPLYWDSPAGAAGMPAPGAPGGDDERRNAPAAGESSNRPVFGIVGSIQRYKGIKEVLEVWPQHSRLLVAGASSAGYLGELSAVVSRRGLNGSVSIRAGFLTDVEFAAILRQIDVLILPHVPNSMLVSGVFFEAAGIVPMILARGSPFMVWAQTQFPGVRCFNQTHELAALVATVESQWPLRSNGAAPSAIREYFGWAACLRAYGEFLDSVVTTR